MDQLFQDRVVRCLLRLCIGNIWWPRSPGLCRLLLLGLSRVMSVVKGNSDTGLASFPFHGKEMAPCKLYVESNLLVFPAFFRSQLSGV